MFQKLTQKHVKDLSFIFDKKNQKHKRNISLNKYNITPAMLKKAKTIFYKNYQQKMYIYLIKLFKQIKIIHWYSDNAKRKNYAIIQINLDKSL
jgi:hypothetical protein